MRIVIVIVVVIGLLSGALYLVSQGGSAFEDAGKLATGAPGRVQVPISASGEARERQRIDVKAEASGTIIEIPVEEGDVVAPGDLLIKLDTEEENRNVERFQAALNQAKANLERTRTEYEQTRENMPSRIALAEAAVELAEHEVEHFRNEYESVKAAADRNDAYNPRELSAAKLQFLRQQNNLTQARIELENIKRNAPGNIEIAKQSYEAAKASQAQAEAQLQDAQRRLRKTEIRNEYSRPCRVVRIYVSEGRLVQSAVTGFGGGDLLMELADVTQMEVEAAVDASDISRVAEMFVEGTRRRESMADAGGAADGPPATNGHADTNLEPSHSTAEIVPRAEDEVVVEFDSLSGKSFLGRIVEIAQKPEWVQNIPTYPVRIRLDDNADIELIRLGMQGKVDFWPVVDEGLCIPHEAVHKNADDEYVVKLPDPKNPRGKPIDRKVEVGLTDGAKVVIHSGLTADQKFYVRLPVWLNPEG